jgi:hypothetical protein
MRVSPPLSEMRVRMGDLRSRRGPGTDGRRDRTERARAWRPASTRPRPSRTQSLRRYTHRHRHRSRRRGDRVGYRFTFRRRRRSGLPDGQQRKRVEIPVRIGGQADAEMDVWLRSLWLAARADRPHDLSIADSRSNGQGNRSQVDEGDGIPVLGADRQAEPLARQPAGVGDDPLGRSAYFGSRRRADVDAAVLTARIRVAAGDERAEHRPLDRPAPRSRMRGMGEAEEQHGHQDAQAVARCENHAPARYRAGRLLSNLITERRGTACSEPGRSDGRRRRLPAVAPLRPARARRLRRARPPRRRTPVRARRGRA